MRANLARVGDLPPLHPPMATRSPSVAQSMAGSLAAILFWTGSALAASPADGVRAIRDLRIEFVRPFGLPAFEDPQRGLVTLEAAAVELAKAVPSAEDETLAPLAVRLLGTNLIAAEAVLAPAGTESPAPLLASPGGMRRLGATGAYASVLQAYARRARDASLVEARPLPDREALRRFADVLEAELAGRGELGGMEVTLESVDGVLTAPSAGSSAATPMALPAVAGFAAIDAGGVREIARQVELAMERDVSIQGADGVAVPLEFTVRAAPADPSDPVLRLLVAFVGPRDQPSVSATRFTLSYVDGAGRTIQDPVAIGLPDPATVLASTRVTLERTVEGGAAYLTDFGGGGEAVTAALDPGFGGDAKLSVSALRSVAESVLATLKADDLMGVYVDFAGGQFDMTRGGVDMRGGDGEVKLVVVPGIVDGVRIVASGERVEGGSAIDPTERRYQRIRERSPFSAGGADGRDARVLRESVLEEFLHRQSRRPNRRVDAAVTPPPEGSGASDGIRGTIGLDYLVSENKPWSVFAQGSNTGTGSTGEWQQRFGVFHSDLFGNDEIVSIEYLTTDFDSMHSVNGYFDGPVGESESLRWKLYGGWYEYSASDVGISSERFEGSSPSVGAELAVNVFQHERLFLDVVGGARWFNVKVNNLLFDLRGEEDFLVPYVGVRVQRNARSAVTDAGIFLDMCVADATDVDAVEINALGRLLPERDWSLLRWDLAQSFYLDPIIGADLGEGTLAHELAFRFRGQYSFERRLIPQQLGVAGGFYTVRGYPESLVSGDTLLLASGEYRLHLPQVLGFDANPQPLFGVGEPFRLRPQFGYGSTDWDLILRAFVDVGRVENVDPFSFEDDRTLIGAGVGVELQLWRNLDLRLDLGFPLKDIEGRDIDSSRLSFVGTLAF